MEVKKLGNFNGFEGGCYSGNTYDAKGLCPALNTMRGGEYSAYDSSYERA